MCAMAVYSGYTQLAKHCERHHGRPLNLLYGVYGYSAPLHAHFHHILIMLKING